MTRETNEPNRETHMIWTRSPDENHHLATIERGREGEEAGLVYLDVDILRGLLEGIDEVGDDEEAELHGRRRERCLQRDVHRKP